MQDFGKTYIVPVTVSTIGLVLALILAVAPLFGRDRVSAPLQAATTQMAEQASAFEELRTVHAAEVAALRQELATQSGKISEFENRLANLDRGVTQNFWRSKRASDSIHGLSGAAQQLSNLENRVTNLDRGVTQGFWRTKANTDVIDTLTSANQRLRNLEAQMDTLNRAVPRISARLRKLKEVAE